MKHKKVSKRERISAAIAQVNKEISDLATGGLYVRGMASEGYAGGYRDALSDALLVMDGVIPKRRDYWERSR